MFAMLCLTFPLAIMQFDAEGVPLPLGVTARYGSTRYLPPSGIGRVRFLPGDKTAVTTARGVMSVWDLDTGLRIREVIEPDWNCSDFSLSKDGKKLFVVGLATTGYAEKPTEPPGKTVKTPIQRIELWTYNSTTLKRIAKTVLTETKSDWLWFNANGTLFIPDYDTKQKVTLVHVEPTIRILPLAIDFQASGYFYPSYNESGSRLAYFYQKEIIVYDTVAMKEITRRPGENIFVKMSKDGASICRVGRQPSENGNNPLELFSSDVETGKVNWRQGFPKLESYPYVYTNESFDDVIQVMGEGLQNHDITYYDARTGKPIPLQPGETYVWRHARADGQLSADRKRMVSCANGAVSIWDAATKQQIAIKKRTFAISDGSRLQFLDGGTKLEVGPSDHNSTSGLKSWDVATGKELFCIPRNRLVEEGGSTIVSNHFTGRSMFLTSRDRSFLVTMTPDNKEPDRPTKWSPVLSDPTTGREIRRLTSGPSHIQELQLTRNGRYLICHDMQTRIWRWDLSLVDPQPIDLGAYTVGGNGGHTIRQFVTVNPDQTLAAVMLRAETTRVDGTAPQYEVGVYRLDDAHQVRRLKGQGMLLHKSWSANGRYLNLSTISGSCIHDLESDRIVFQLKNQFEGSIRDDGRMICSIVDSELTFHETLTGQVRHTIATSGTSPSVAFAPDRRSVAHVASDNTVHIVPLFPLSKHLSITRVEMDAALADLGSNDARKAFRAVRLLASDPKMAVPYLRETIPPTKLPVDVAATIAKLDSSQFAERDAATKRLIEIGSAASGPLQIELKNTDSVELRTRIEQILATHGTTSANDLRAHRAHEILDILDTAEARSLRESWVKGEPSILTAIAKAKPRNAPFAFAATPKVTP